MSQSNLPALPQAGAAISVDDAQRWERQVIAAVAVVEDVERLDEWRNQAAALETYLRGKEMQAPMMGAQRRIEARIGQLLGPAPERGGKEMSHHADSFHREVRREFRLMAKAFNGECDVSDIEWRTSRRGLVSLIRDRVPKPVKPAPTPKTNGRSGARITVPDGMTAEALCRRAIQLEKNGATCEQAAASIGVGIGVYRGMRDIMVISDVPYLTEWDKARVAVVIEDLNEHRQVRRNRESLNDIASRLWGKGVTRGGDLYEAAVKRRVENFETARRAICNACAAASRVEVPYLDRLQVNTTNTAIEAAVRQLRTFQRRINSTYKRSGEDE